MAYAEALPVLYTQDNAFALLWCHPKFAVAQDSCHSYAAGKFSPNTEQVWRGSGGFTKKTEQPI